MKVEKYTAYISPPAPPNDQEGPLVLEGVSHNWKCTMLHSAHASIETPPEWVHIKIVLGWLVVTLS